MDAKTGDAKALSNALKREQYVDQLKKRRQCGHLISAFYAFKVLQIDQTDEKQVILCEIIKLFANYQARELISTLPVTGLLCKLSKFTQAHLRKPNISLLKSTYRDFMEALGFPAYSDATPPSEAQHSPDAQDAVRHQLDQLRLRMKNNSDLAIDSKDFEVVKALENILVPGFLLWRDTGVLFKNKELVVKVFEDGVSPPAYE